MIESARQFMAERSAFLVELPMDEITPEAGVVLGELQRKGFTLSGSILEILRQVGINHSKKNEHPPHQYPN